MIKKWLLPFLFCLQMLSQFVSAQYFRGDAMTIPVLGWNSVDSFIPWNPQAESDEDRFVVSDQFVIAIGYMGAIIDTSLWWTMGTTFAFGSTYAPGLDFKGATAAVGGYTGLRYNFLEERLRPFVSASFDLLHTFGRDGISFPFQIGPRAELGFEWIFGDEIGVQLSAGYLPWFNFSSDNLVRHTLATRFAFNLYL